MNRPSLFLLLSGVFALGACNGDGSSDSSDCSDALDCCYALCAQQAAYDTCSADPDNTQATCDYFCDAVLEYADDPCLEASQTYFECGAQAEWECIGEGIYDNPLGCEAESEAYSAACF